MIHPKTQISIISESDLDQYWQQWDTLTQAAMKLIPDVDQRLWHLIDSSVGIRIDNAIKGLEPFRSVRELKMPEST